jgi:CheY-like chemotaxis protein
VVSLKLRRIFELRASAPLKADAAFKMIPVVVMTSSREEQDLLNSYQLGVNAYVVKPMKFESFVQAVEQVGAFWAVINEPPPGSLRRDGRAGF